MLPTIIYMLILLKRQPADLVVMVDVPVIEVVFSWRFNVFVRVLNICVLLSRKYLGFWYRVKVLTNIVVKEMVCLWF